MKSNIVWLTLLLILLSLSARSQALLLDKAYEHLKKNELEPAQKAIDAAVMHESTRNDPRAWYYQGFVYKELYKKNPASGEAHREKAMTAFRKSMALDAKNRYMSDCRQGIQYLATTYYNDGIDLLNRNQYEKAVASFRQYVASKTGDKPDAQYAEALYQTGYAYFMQRNLTDARTYYEQALGLNYQNPYLYDDLATIYLETNHPELAEPLIASGRKKFPQNPNLRVAEINLLMARNDFARAETLVDEYLAADPKNTNVLLVAGTIYGKIPSQQPARKDHYFAKRKTVYQQILAIDSMHFAANYNMGITLYNRAVDLINEQSQSYDIDIMAFQELLQTCTALFKEALPYVSKANQLSPNNVSTLKALEGIYYNLNEKEKSKQIRERINSMN